jgi:hypothetical protein
VYVPGVAFALMTPLAVLFVASRDRKSGASAKLNEIYVFASVGLQIIVGKSNLNYSGNTSAL